MAWNWYDFVGILILYQARPTDATDIKARLQFNDTSSIPPMHDGYLIEAEWRIYASLI